MNKQTRKRMAILTIVSTMIMGGLFAQPGQGQQQQPPPIPDESQVAQMVDELTQTLSLTGEQTTAILELYSDHFAEVKSQMEDGRPDRTKMDKLKNKFEKKVKALLTDEQKEQFDEFLQSQRPQQSERPQRGPRR